MSALSRHLRILPVVMVLVAGALAVRSSDLLDIARAQAAPAGAAPSANQPAPKASTANASQADSDPAAAAEDSSDSAAELDLLTSLSKRRAEIDARAKQLDMRANLLTAAEQRVDAKIADLKALEAQIQGLLGQRDAAEQKQVTALVKVYSSMKPRDAARIFNSLDEPVLLSVAGAMKPDSLAAIMAAMEPQEAQALTVKLANRLKLPKTPDLTPPAQVAAAAPPPALPQGAAPSTNGAPVPAPPSTAAPNAPGPAAAAPTATANAAAAPGAPPGN